MLQRVAFAASDWKFFSHYTMISFRNIIPSGNLRKYGHCRKKGQQKNPAWIGVLQRRRPDLNRCIRVLQTYAARPATPHSYWLCCPSDPHDHLKSTLLYGGSQFLNQTDYSITWGWKQCFSASFAVLLYFCFIFCCFETLHISERRLPWIIN